MSSKASSTPAKPALPSFFTLLKNSCHLLTKNYKLAIGYTSWLLLPIALHIIIRVTLGHSNLGGLLDLVDNVALAFVAINIFNVITLHVPIWQTKFANQSELLVASTTAETAAWRNILPVFLANLLAGFVCLVGSILVIPGLIFITWFAFVKQIVLFEHTRGTAALIASRNLVRDRVWGVTWRLWAFIILFFALYLIIGGLILFAFGFNPSQPFDTMTPPLAADALISLLEIAIFPLIIVYFTLLYQSLKVE